MLNAQASRAERRALATFIIENDGDLETVKKRAVALDEQLKQRFKGSD
jgi:dephospho-CoA kinase